MLYRYSNTQTWRYRDILYTNILYTWQSLYATKFIQTLFIRNKIYTGQSLYSNNICTQQNLYGNKIYTNIIYTVTKFIRNKIYTNHYLYRNKIDTWLSLGFFVTIFIHFIENHWRLYTSPPANGYSPCIPQIMSPPPLSIYISTCTWILTMYMLWPITYPKECIHVIINKHWHTVYDLIAWIIYFNTLQWSLNLI